MNEKTCATCANFQPNGGVLKMGYCMADKWTYRKPTQHCKDKYVPGVPNDSDGQGNLFYTTKS